MTDLPQLLGRAAGADPEPAALTASVHADVLRGRRALARTRRRRSALGLAGVAAAGVVGAGAVHLTGDHHSTHTATDTRSTHTSTVHRSGGVINAVALLDQPLQAGPYSFGTTPEGWELGGVTPSAVTIIPTDGSTGNDPDVFVGKLVIMLDTNPPSGQQTTVDGRTYWVRGDSGYTTIETHTRAGEPDGMVSVQFPDDTGWAQATMLQFLSTVQVGPGAEPGVG